MLKTCQHTSINTMLLVGIKIPIKRSISPGYPKGYYRKELIMKGFIIKQTTLDQLKRMSEDTLRVNELEEQQRIINQQQQQQQMQQEQQQIIDNTFIRNLFTDEQFRQQMFDNIWMNM